MQLRDALLVAVGGAAGSLARFALSSAWPTKLVPWATLAANLAGAFAIGLLLLPSGLEHGTRLLVAVGFLGGFTTLSTFSAEAVELWRAGHAAAAAGYILATGLGGPALAWLGWRVGAALAS